MKKYKIHVIQNSHTDLGYTHRQEYVYRAHARYLENILDIIKKNKEFRWTMENFWMFENFKKWSTPERVMELKEAINSNNIEITGGYLNLLNIVDKDAYSSKVSKAINEFPHIKTAIQQDINSIDKEQAKILSNHGIKNIYVSIHTHHGMFVGDGKQRGFIWELGDSNNIIVWGGEHYMLGNELGLHLEVPNKYTFKDNVEKITTDGFEQGLMRLNSYLDQLDNEGYPHDVIPVVLSGTVIDNSPPNESIIEGVEKMNQAIGDRAELVISSMGDFFADLDKSKLPTYKGSWPSWWVDGVISTPEAVRQYREAQMIYKNISAYQMSNNTLSSDDIKSLELNLLLFSEHTWGSWSSQGNPFSNGNNLLLNRKIAMATEASKIAWTILDDMKEKEGYNIVKVNETNEYIVFNPHNIPLSQVVSLEIPRHGRDKLETNRFVDREDAFEIVDSQGKVYESAYSHKMGIGDNINSSIETDKVILTKVSLKANERIILKFVEKDIHHSSGTSSFRPIGVDNQDDVNYKSNQGCKYLRNGIESNDYIIKWNENGVYSIISKINNIELLEKKNSIRPISVYSPQDSRTMFGRNRQGPSASYSYGKLVSHSVEMNKPNIQIVKLHFALEGTKVADLVIRISSVDKKIRFQLILHKKGTVYGENLYINIPFLGSEYIINSETESFVVGREQLPRTNLDYFKTYGGMVVKNSQYDVGIYTQDMPLIQLGSLLYERRHLMDVNEGQKNQIYSPMIWVMSNYWETNYKGTLEGTYSFSFDISVSKNEIKEIQNSTLKLFGFKVWK